MSVFSVQITKNMINLLVSKKSGIRYTYNGTEKEVSYETLQSYSTILNQNQHDIGTFVAPNDIVHSISVSTVWDHIEFKDISISTEYVCNKFVLNVTKNGPLYIIMIDWQTKIDPPIVSCECVKRIQKCGSGWKQIDELKLCNKLCSKHLNWHVFKQIINSIESNSYKIDALKLVKFDSGNARDIISCIQSDPYKIDALKTLRIFTDELVGVLSVINDDSYRIDAVKLYKFDMTDQIIAILNCFDSDSYKYDVLKCATYKCVDREQTHNIITCFEIDSYRFDVIQKYSYQVDIKICLIFDDPSERLRCLKMILIKNLMPNQNECSHYIEELRKKKNNEDYAKTLELLLSGISEEHRGQYIKHMHGSDFVNLAKKFNVKMSFDELIEIATINKNCDMFELVDTKLSEDEYDKLLAIYLENPSIGGATQVICHCVNDAQISINLFADILKNDDTVMEMIDILIKYQAKISDISDATVVKYVQNNYYRNCLAKSFGLNANYGFEDGSGLRKPEPLTVTYFKETDVTMCLYIYNSINFKLTVNDMKEYRRYLTNNNLKPVRRFPFGEKGRIELSINGISISADQEEIEAAIHFFQNPPKYVKIELKSQENNLNSKRMRITGINVNGGVSCISGISGIKFN